METRGGWLLALCILGAASVAAAVEVRRVSLPTRGLVNDPVRQRLYASVPGISPTLGNRVVRIDPTTGKVDASVFVGSEPGALAIDDGASVLYVGLEGARRIVRVDLDSFTTDLDFPIGSAGGAFLAERILVMPGNREVIAVQRSQGQFSDAGGVAIFDHGVPRPQVIPVGWRIRSLVWSDDPALLYGLVEFQPGLYTYGVNPSGVGPRGAWNDAVPYGVTIAYAGGAIYTSEGQVLLPEARELAGTFSGANSAFFTPDVERNRVFYLVGSQIYVFDRTTFVRVATIDVPGISAYPYYSRADLVRWGHDGLAFGTDDDLVLIRTETASSDPCRDVPRCDPLSGQCTQQPFFDGAPCNDENVCTTGESCQSGVCGRGTVLDCDDGNPCTLDACDARDGCTHTTVSGSCWGIAGRAVANACAPSGCRKQSSPFGGALILGEDDTYRIPSTRVCEANQQRFPDERGTVKPARHGWLALRPSNVKETVTALKACASITRITKRIEIQTLRNLRQKIMIPTSGGSFCRWNPAPADGQHLCGLLRSQGTISVQGTTVNFRVVGRFGGARLDVGPNALMPTNEVTGSE
jgi:DNA-binding beta-propeller fold protein YncE